MIDEKIDQKEADEIKKIYNHYLDKRKEIMKNTQFKAEDVFGDIISKDNFSQEQTSKQNIFSQIIVNINFSITVNLFKPGKEKIKNYEPSAPPYYEQLISI